MKSYGLALAVLMCVANTAHSQDTTWPQELTAKSGTVVVIYQPQGEEFKDNNLEARAAVSVKGPATGNTPMFGAIWFSAKLDTNRDTRTAVIRDIDVSDVRFVDFSEGDREALAKFIEDSVGGASLVISVDQLLTDLDTASSGQQQADLKHTAPIIMLSTEPAILVSIDGDPVFQQIEGSRYERVVNSAFLIVRGGNNHYLYAGSNTWYQAGDVAGPWAIAANVPGDVEELVEPGEGDAEDLADTKIIIATEPSELLVTAGPPTWTPVEGMELLYLQNTDSNVFMELTTQKYYVLLSGRWYRGEGVVGDIEWVHVPNDELPVPFGDIPADSVNGAVRSQVAGTQEARDAVLDNTIPQTAAIDRDDASFSVEYDGAPDFAPIEDINVEYAQNTASAVFKYGNLYYACNDGVWYVANSATGPWSVATEIPDAIYKIPASNPHHNVIYVKVYDVTPEVVYVGYTPGYYGSYYSYGSVVYGTGWYYRPWYGPYYYPRYPTWGFHVTYNPWTGWGIGVSWTNGPFRFTFRRHGGWWGVGGYRPYGRGHVHGGYRKPNINNGNIGGGNVGNGNVGGGQNRPDTRPNLYDRPENRTRNAERPATADNRMGRPATGQQNNVLTDRSGNVYQRDNNGSWAQRDNGQWTKPDNLDRSSSNNAASGQRPATSDQGRAPSTSQQGSLSDRSSSSTSGQSATRPQLERDYNARQQGAQRTQNYQRQSSGQRRSSGGQRRR